MATIPALVLSRDEVILLLRMLGAHHVDYAFSLEQYKAMEEAHTRDLIGTMQAVARQEE